MRRTNLQSAISRQGGYALAQPSRAEIDRFGKKDGEDFDPKDVVRELRSVKSSLESQHTQIKSWTEKAAAEIKELGQLSETTKAALEKHARQGEELAAKFGELEQLVAGLAKNDNGPGAEKSLGALVTEDEKVKSWLERGGDKAGVKFALKAINSGTSGGGAAGDLIIPQRRPGIVRAPDRAFFIRDLLSVGRTTSNSIEYVQETGFTNAAAPVAELDLKPESDLSFELKSTPVRTIAHWIRASKQILADVPALQSYIDTRMRWGLAFEEEQQVLAGDGTGQNLLGLIPQATPFDVNRVRAGDTRIDVVRRAMTQVRLAEYRADAIVLHPSDWEEIELTKTDEGSYVWANPRGLLGPTLWGLPVVDTTAVEPGEFIVGNFQMAAMLWDREDASVDISLEDRDNFIRNAVTIRAEERLALEVSRPEAIIYGDFDDTPISG